MAVKALLPDRPDSWHVNPILLSSVRQEPSDRFQDATDMANTAKKIARTVVGRYPPLELVRRRCYVCGRGHLQHGLPNHQLDMRGIYRNPLPKGTSCYVCNVCGHVCVWYDSLLDSHSATFDNAE